MDEDKTMDLDGASNQSGNKKAENLFHISNFKPSAMLLECS
jgi:hypothetical protein